MSLDYKIKYCYQCKYYMEKNEVSKCSKFSSTTSTTLKKKNMIDYYNCSVARNFNNLCGQEGKYFCDSK